MNSEFLDIPEFVWTAAFSVFKILGVGLIMGFFATKYQKRKEIEYGLQGEIVKNRIKAYQRIINVLSEIYHSIAPPAILQLEYDKLLDGMPFTVSTVQYPAFMDSPSDYDSYYKNLSHICNEEHIFLDANVEYRLNEYLSYLSEIKMMLDAFCDLENSRATNINKEKRDELIKQAYQTFGIALSNDFGRFYNSLDNIIVKEVSTMTLGFRNKRLRIYLYGFRSNISTRIIKLYHSQHKFLRFTADSIYKLCFSKMVDSALMRYPSYLIVLLMRIHFSTHYSVEQFDSLPNKERTKLFEEFRSSFFRLYHV